MKKHMNILMPQWQGGGIKATYEGAMSLKDLYLQEEKYVEIPVSMNEECTIKENIKYFDDIMKQMASYQSCLEEEHPDTVFTMGGGDDIDILPMTYLNQKYNADMAVAFFDAHGDLNSPETSPSKNFHGMPLRAAFGDCPKPILAMMDSVIKPEQVVMIGTRDCDPEEEDFIASHHITVVRANQVNEQPKSVVDALKTKGKENLYIHIDIDVVDPGEFPWQPVPAEEGLQKKKFIETLEMLNTEFNIVGVCLLGYTKMDERDEAITKIINIGLNL